MKQIFNKEILIKDLRTNKFITFKWNNQKKFQISEKALLKAKAQGKIEIIPQDINKFIEKGKLY